MHFQKTKNKEDISIHEVGVCSTIPYFDDYDAADTYIVNVCKTELPLAISQSYIAFSSIDF